LRNAVDHGVETPEERAKTGKPEQGTIRLSARREKTSAVIEIIDDGAGINIEKVKQKSIQRGFITKEEANTMSDDEACLLIFHPGNSTNDVVTEVSGRGVGMDVVMSKTKEIGGTIKLHSTLGKGTTISLYLPLTVAIITALIVRAGKDRYCISLNTVDETVHIEQEEIKTIQKNKVFVLRHTEIPIFWLQELLGQEPPNDRKKLTAVIVMQGTERVGIVVDEIISQQQILIKTLQDMVKGTRGCAGATILGDGSVSLILDINTLLP
jgi:two-component system, chemotaxis family, sensor kinase CheA